MNDNLVVVPVEIENQFLWCIFEKATDQVINHFFFEEDAHDYVEFVNEGGAFAGFTPTFMTNALTFDDKPDINLAFESEARP